MNNKITVFQWLPNGKDLTILPLGIHIFGTNPNCIPSKPELPSSANRYGVLLFFKTNYSVLIYINLMGEFYFWTTTTDWKKL